MAAQVEPGDRHRDPDSENYGARETDGRQSAIERDMRAERQTICPENFEQPNPPGSDNEPEQSADESQENGFDQPEWRCCGVRSSHLDLIGGKRRASEERNRKSGGNTPTIFLGMVFTRMSRSRTLGSELRRCRQ